MQKRFFHCQPRAMLTLSVALGVAFTAFTAEAQQTGQLVQPIYRVAHEEPAAEQAPATRFPCISTQTTNTVRTYATSRRTSVDARLTRCPRGPCEYRCEHPGL